MWQRINQIKDNEVFKIREKEKDGFFFFNGLTKTGKRRMFRTKGGSRPFWVEASKCKWLFSVVTRNVLIQD